MNQESVTALISVGTAFFCIIVATFLVSVYFTPTLDGTTSDEPLEVSYEVGSEKVRVEYEPNEILGYTEGFRGFSFTITAYRFVTLDDPVVQKLHRTVLEPRMEGMDDYGKADFLRKFVQANIIYDFDIYAHGMADYTQYPSETLISKHGDCEDSAILLHTLYRMAGLDSVLVEESSHVYVAVAVDGTGEHVVPPFSDTRYYTVETTSNWEIGLEGHDEAWHFVYHPYGVVIAEFCLFFSLFGLIAMWNYRNTEDVAAVTLNSEMLMVGETQ